MRIARVLTRLNLGGPARQVLASDPRLQARGHVLRIFTGVPEPGEGDLFEVARERGLDVVRVPGLVRGVAPARDLRARRELARRLAEFAPDVLHTHASKAGALGRAALRRVAGEERVARIHTFHGHVLEGYFPGPISRRLAAHERKLARETDRVVAVSHATAEDLVRLEVVAEEKLVVVPPGVELDALLAIERGAPSAPRGVPSAPRGVSDRGADPSAPRGALRAEIGAGPEDFVVGVVGRLAAVKQHDLALEVFELLAARYPRLHLAFIGDGTERLRLERRVVDLAARHGDRVHLLGNRTEMPAVYVDLDAVLSTSRSEGLPVALIEAGAAALPVVATDVGGVGEVVAHERTGFLGTGVEDLAFGLAQLLDDPALGAALGRRARLRVAEHHGPEQLADRLEQLYEVVTSERAGAGRERR